MAEGFKDMKKLNALLQIDLHAAIVLYLYFF